MSDSAIAPVIFFWRGGCRICQRLETGLIEAGVELDKIDIWSDPAAAARVRQITGGDETVPTVIADGMELVNPTVAQVLGALGRSTD